MRRADWDAVVIGAGIHGAGCAQALAAAGHRVLVLEQTAVAAGTSSRSSKLIHGGLRYLETGQFGLVRECLAERERLLRLAPGLVHLTPHFIPVYPGMRRPAWKIRLGLTLYAVLGGLGPHVRHRRLRLRDWPNPDGLRREGLRALFQYQDGQTDDAALTRAVMASAESLGARLAVPARFEGARWEEGRWRLRWQQDGAAQSATARTLVNAAGPWVNAVLERIEPRPPRAAVELVAGTHLVFDRPLHAGVYYVEAPDDGRAVFLMPWQGDRTLVGTTERPWDGDPGAVAPSAAEVDYLRRTAAHYLPAFAALEPAEAFAGLRVLPAADGDPFRRARETLFQQDQEGHLVSILGGKLTAYRVTAARVAGLLAPWLPRRARRADTAALRLGLE